MRVFELSTHIKSISRGGGRSATAAAAYRACCAIPCEREGRVHDFSRKTGLEACAIVLPEGAPAWDRARLWNEAELRERNGKRGPRAGLFKANAQAARELMFSFPAELSQAGRLSSARIIARHLADTHKAGADFSIHRPGKDGDQRNFHCHLMMTTRRLTAKGLGAKTREWDDLKTRSVLAKGLRAFVAKTLNEALAAEGKAALVHVEHRSFKARGETGRATRHQGPGRTNAARKERKSAREAWQRAARKEQAERHAKERAALKTRQDFALAAKTGDLAERERRGIAAIRDALAKAQAADKAPEGLSRVFRKATGRAMGDEFARQGRMAERVAQANRDIAALKESLRAERTSFAAAQTRDAAVLRDRHGLEDRQLQQASGARRDFDRVSEVEGRREQAAGIERERQHGRERGRGPGEDGAP